MFFYDKYQIIFINDKLFKYYKIIKYLMMLFYGDWGLGIGDLGFGFWAQNPKTKTQNPKTKNK